MSKLKDRQEQRKKGCYFMSDREKGEFADLENGTYTLEDAYKIHGDDGDFWAFIIREETELFYFANNSLKMILEDAADIAEEEGCSIKKILDGNKIHVGTMQPGNKGRKFRPVDLVD